MASERLQKILARAGVASRRAAEELIRAGRVSIDGKVVTELGVRADIERQRIALDGKLLAAEDPVYVVFHKPRGVVCTMSDPEGRETVADYMKQVTGRVVPVGRLDYHTSGVLLLTNDGEFAAALLHPSHHVEKVYVAKVRGVVNDTELEGWRQSVEIDGRATQPAEVRRLRVEGDKTWLEITLREGRNRQIHRLGEAAGSAIFRLARLSFAGITSDGLRPGQWRYLGREELAALKKAYGVPRKIFPAPPLPNAATLRRRRAEGIGKGERGVADGKPIASRGLRRAGANLGQRSGEARREEGAAKFSGAERGDRRRGRFDRAEEELTKSVRQGQRGQRGRFGKVSSEQEAQQTLGRRRPPRRDTTEEVVSNGGFGKRTAKGRGKLPAARAQVQGHARAAVGAGKQGALAGSRTRPVKQARASGGAKEVVSTGAARRKQSSRGKGRSN